ncbi:MAG: glycine cleavage system protein H [Proteobacteria bacterium]|nr:glycine cleavage system protein H [Pseudomonadota bacterium]
MSSAHRYHLPRDRRYHPREHLWVKPEGAGEPESVLIGMDELQLDNLGELAYVDLKPAGTVVQAGDSFGTLEAAKMTAEIFAPLSGTIVQVNEAALTRPLLVNEEPYAGGWLVELAPSQWQEEWPGLIGGDGIDGWVAAEELRLKEQFDGPV